MTKEWQEATNEYLKVSQHLLAYGGSVDGYNPLQLVGRESC